MAEITRAAKGASLASITPPHSNTLPALFAGTALVQYDACYIKSDGLVYPSSGAAANAAAKVRGFAARKYAAAEPVTLVFGIEVQYADATMTPGNDLYASATVNGGLVTTSTTGGTSPVGFAVTSSRAFLKQSTY
jgi:hypothetical protein